jgi:hypothetical protein
MSEKKSFFHVSTSALLIICIIGLISFCYNFYLINDLTSYQSVIVDRVEYFKGTPEYEPVIRKMKNNFAISASLAIGISLISILIIFLRKTRKNI